MEARYRRDIDAACTRGDWKAERELQVEYIFERDEIDDEIHLLMHQHIRSAAERMFISVPDFYQEGPDWVKSEKFGKWRLSKDAINRIRSTIRKETKERYQHFIVWGTAIAGIISALIGFFSIL